MFSTKQDGRWRRPAIEPRQFEYRGYRVVVVRYPPIFQAAIYPTQPGMVEIDWTMKPIWAEDRADAEEAVRERIDEALERLTTQ